MTNKEQFSAACILVSTTAGEVKDNQWSNPTPDTEWDVKTLLNHITSEILWVPDLLAGKTIAEVGDKYDGDVLGSDPIATWAKAAEAASAAVSSADPEAVTHLSFGDTPADEYIGQMAFDQLIHGWDLARAISANYEPSTELIQDATTFFTPQAEAWRSTGALGPIVETGADAPAWEKLLALSGRKIDWKAPA